jgi:hypothetical protein
LQSPHRIIITSQGMFVKGGLLNSALLYLHPFIVPNCPPHVAMNEPVSAVTET